MVPSPAGAPVRWTVEVMGTVVSFDARPGPAEPGRLHVARTRAEASLRRTDAVFSTWKPDSPVSRLRRGEADLADMPPEVVDVLDLCEQARELSAGWFDPWALPGGLDPTGLVKGWGAERALGHLEEVGVAGAMVNAGGDICTCGDPEPGRAWRVGVRHPADATRVVAVVEGARAVATSGHYERGPHVLDPHTGHPASGVASATVAGPSLWLADALATALMAAGPAGIEAMPGLLASSGTGCSAFLILEDGSRAASRHFPFGHIDSPGGAAPGD